MFDHLEANGMFLGGFSRVLAGVALIGIDQLHPLSGHLLHGGGERLDLRAILFVGGRDAGSQEMAKRVDGDVDLGAFLALGPLPTGSVAGLGAGLQGAAVEDGGGGPRFAAGMIA
jgi:hypothetical protein